MSSDELFEQWATDFYEWLGLVSLESPRVLQADSIDPFLSRYRVPQAQEQDENRVTNMISLTWRGLIPRAWIRELLIQLKLDHPHDR